MIKHFSQFLNEKKSPYKPETLVKYKKKWKNGDKIPFGVEASLKAQGMIPRADGTYEVSPEYKKEKKSTFSPETPTPASHADKVEKRIHKEEKERLNKSKKDEIIDKHPESKSKHENPDDKGFEGNVKKTKDPKVIKAFKKNRKKNLKTYSDKPTSQSELKPSKSIKMTENFKSFDDFNEII